MGLLWLFFPEYSRVGEEGGEAPRLGFPADSRVDGAKEAFFLVGCDFLFVQMICRFSVKVHLL